MTDIPVSNRMAPLEVGLEEHFNVFNSLDLLQIMDVADATIECLRKGGKVLIAGNGGSAADAQHIAAELVGRFKLNRKALPAIALTTDTSILTAVSNDYSYEDVFARQIEALIGRKDVFWAFSTSGNSPNILKAVMAAHAAAATVCVFTGSSGKLAAMADYAIKVPHSSSDRIQEAHQFCYHIICQEIEKAFYVQGQ